MEFTDEVGARTGAFAKILCELATTRFQFITYLVVSNGKFRASFYTVWRELRGGQGGKSQQRSVWGEGGRDREESRGDTAFVQMLF